MRLRHLPLAAAAVQLCVPAGAQTAMMPIQTGGTNAAPVPVNPPTDPKETPESIAKDAARDLQESHFYNRPGATRADYDKDWGECRLIARGSRTPTGTVPMFYNPNLVSPAMAGLAGGMTSVLAMMLQQGAQRRENRRNCLLIRGWRQVEVPGAETDRVRAMTDAQRSDYFNTIVGARTVSGKITDRTSFTMKTDPSMKLDTPITAAPVFFLGKKVDTKAPFVLAAGEAAVVVAQVRPTPETSGRSLYMTAARYDLAARDLVYQPRDWKKTGDKTTYSVALDSADRTAAIELQVRRITPGDYVIRSAGVSYAAAGTSNCFGAPTFHVDAGDVLYLGDFIPVGRRS